MARFLMLAHLITTSVLHIHATRSSVAAQAQAQTQGEAAANTSSSSCGGGASSSCPSLISGGGGNSFVQKRFTKGEQPAGQSGADSGRFHQNVEHYAKIAEKKEKVAERNQKTKEKEACTVPPTVENQASGGACKEGTKIYSGSKCTAQCDTGYSPSKIWLTCYKSKFTSTFTCPVTPTSICGQTTPELNAILKPPPVVQKILKFGLGISWTIGDKNTYKAIDAEDGNGGTCEHLPLPEGRQFVLVHMTTPDPKALLTGAAADKKNKDASDAQKQKTASKDPKKQDKSNPLKDGFKDVMARVPIPLCIAIRPCGTDKDSFLEKWDFGFMTDAGIPLYQTGPLELTLQGLAFSSDANLVPLPFSPELYGLETGNRPSKVHWWLQGEMTFGLKKGSKEMASVKVTGKYTAYVNVNGESDIAEIFAALADSGGAPDKIADYLKTSTYHFQFCGSTATSVTLKLKNILGKAGKNMEDMNLDVGESSFLIDAKVSPGGGYLAYYYTGTKKLDLRSLLSCTGFLEKVMPSVTPSITYGMYIKIYSTGKVDFGIMFRVSMKLDCGYLDDLTIPAGAPSPMSFFKDLQKICTGNHEFEVSLAITSSRLDRKKSCLKFGGTPYCLDRLPSCPVGAQVGESCEKNHDCVATEDVNTYGESRKGYCKSQNGVTTIACMGKCIALIEDGGSCDARATGTHLNTAVEAEHEACESDSCLCGQCGGTNTKLLANGLTCSTKANCESNRCYKGALLEEAAKPFCNGECAARKENNHECFFDSDCQSDCCNAVTALVAGSCQSARRRSITVKAIFSPPGKGGWR